MTSERTPERLSADAIVVGAGFAGMYMLHRLRSTGRNAVVIEAGTDVGGTWYWNRYPGARCDVPSMEYSYSFSPELEQEWEWTEVMSGQPEILRYAQHVADRFDLRRDIRFETRVTSATYDQTTRSWSVTTDRGDRYDAPVCIMATGCLSASNTPDIPGLADFGGPVLHTGRWPKEEPDLTDKRVGIIGTGSSGVQAIPELARRAGHLTVFQRTPAYTFPANNKPLRDDVQQAYKDHYDEVRRMQRDSVAGFSGFRPTAAAEAPRAAVDAGPPADKRTPRRPRPQILDASPEERREAWDRRGFGVFQYYRDVYRDLDANSAARELYREHVLATVDDPEVATRLAPDDYPLGCKRQILDTDFYPTFNRDNVDLVDLRSTPIETIHRGGIRTSVDDIALDVLVMATGFDAMTGALDRIEIAGRDGQLLRDAWADGPRSYLGLQIAGFPNLFTITGPGSPSVLSNVIVSIEHHVDWITDLLDHMDARDLTSVEPDPDAEARWQDHVAEVAEGTMYVAPSCNSWYLGSNIEGKARTFMPYVGGVGRYQQRCAEITENGYEGFVLA